MGEVMNEAEVTAPVEAPKEASNVTVLSQVKKKTTKMKKLAKGIDKIKVKDQKTAARKLTKILALWVVAVRMWVQQVWKTYASRGARALGKFLKKIGKFFLSLVNLDSPGKMKMLREQSSKVFRGAGQQALAAALMALLTSLADGARVAMSELIKDGSSKILHAIVEGAAEGFSESTSQQPSLFGQHRPTQPVSPSPFQNGYSQNSSYNDNRPPWARS